jgi:cobaltochelatase CobN
VNDVRRRGRESVEAMQTFLAHELNGRYWNPKWIEEMKRGGYAGAREMMDNLENLYGWQMTSAEHMDGAFWQNSYDVYVADKHGLALDRFFERENPHVRQMMVARMLEVDRQGVHKFAGAERERLLREYVTSVNRVGVACSANTCGNSRLLAYVRTRAPLVPGLGQKEVERYGQTVARALSPRPAVAAALAGRTTPAARRRQPQASNTQQVTGFRMEEKILDARQGSSPNSLPARPIGYFLLAGLVGAGVLREFGRRRSQAQ